MLQGKTDRGESDLRRSLDRNPVIPAVRGPDSDLELALSGDHPAIFVLGGDIFGVIERLEDYDDRSVVCVNVDLVGGVRADVNGIRFLARHVEGVISTHRHVIEIAKDAGLLTIHRLFAIDSGAVDRGLKLIRRASPQYVEILPALAYPEIAADYSKMLEQPVLAGGLLKTKEAVSLVLEAGAAGISTSNRGLWNKA